MSGGGLAGGCGATHPQYYGAVTLSQAFSRLLARIMRHRGMSARRLAARSGMSPSTVDRIVSERQGVKLDQVEKIADGLDVKPSRLVAAAEDVQDAD